jgi:hypothetical protein
VHTFAQILKFLANTFALMAIFVTYDLDLELGLDPNQIHIRNRIHTCNQIHI